jgi:cobalt/nickel transport system permease protein
MKREQQLKRLSLSGLAAGLLLLVVPEQAFAMHIMEGFLPPMWALAWWMLFLPCLWYGLVRLRRIVAEDSNQKVLLALCGAFIFVLSALKIPSVTGSCSHPTWAWRLSSSGRAWWLSSARLCCCFRRCCWRTVA